MITVSPLGALMSIMHKAGMWGVCMTLLVLLSLSSYPSRPIRAGTTWSTSAATPDVAGSSLKRLNRLGIGGVRNVYWSADGRRLAFVGPSGVWDYPFNEQGQAQRLVENPPGRVISAALST